MDFCRKQPCDNCPYRKDAPIQHWHISEFIRLLEETKDVQFGKVYGCHKKDGHVCVGWLILQDRNRLPNINLRIMLSQKNVTRDYMDNIGAKVKLFDTVEEMIKANYPQLIDSTTLNLTNNNEQ